MRLGFLITSIVLVGCAYGLDWMYRHGKATTTTATNIVEADGNIPQPQASIVNISNKCVFRRNIRRYYTWVSTNIKTLWPPKRLACDWKEKNASEVLTTDYSLTSFLVGEDTPSVVHCLDETTVQDTTEDDVLFSHLRPYQDYLNLLHGFPGKILLYNPEAYEVRLHGRKESVSPVDNIPTRIGSKQPVVVVGPGTEDEMNDITSPRVPVHLMSILLNMLHRDSMVDMFEPRRKRFNTKKYFCMYAISHCIIRREVAAHLLSTTIKPIHVAGGCEGNPDGIHLRSGYRSWGILLYGGPACSCMPLDDNVAKDRIVRIKNNNTWHQTNIDMFNDYRFALVMENSVRDGYITEKIMNAFLAGSIPIYHGTREVFDIFNPKAFIYWDADDPTKALEQIAYLEANQTAYDEMLYNEPILKDGYRSVDRYFSVAQDLGNGYLYRKVQERLGYTCIYDDDNER